MFRDDLKPGLILLLHLPKPQELRTCRSIPTQDLDRTESRMSFHTEALDWTGEMSEV